jgi:hypothetical protein
MCAIDARPIAQHGRQYILHHDPLQLCERSVVVPSPLHLILPLCDGTRQDANARRVSAAVRHGIQLALTAIAQPLQALNAAGLRPVTQVSIDQTWSALPYRPAERVGKK